MTHDHPVLEAFRRAARSVPAYRGILARCGVNADAVSNMDDFARVVPVLDKQATFGSYDVADLCADGQLGDLAAVLTSSGHSGKFAFGLYDVGGGGAEVEWTDAALDMVFGVKSRRTLLINCLPMGVKVFTRCCTLGETSVRADMVMALVKQFGRRYEQIILVGEAAFIKHVLELGLSQGVNWKDLLVQVIVGEEPLAENARKYLQQLLGIDPRDPATGLVGSSMGVAELGLNLFFELPPLIAARRALHENETLRRSFLGDATVVPMIFAYDPLRIFVEIGEHGRLIITTLDPSRRLPLIRYAPGDFAAAIPAAVLEALGATVPAVGGVVPLLAVLGRGQYVQSASAPVFPEAVKEGIYHEPELAAKTTANFRLVAGQKAATVRIQLVPGAAPSPQLDERFAAAMAHYVPAALQVRCELYETFGSGMSLDYERKFDYTGA
jgi:phenylacetate-CoA ligase